MNENELMQKLALSKAIMQKSDTIKRGSVSEPMVPSIGVDDFQIPQATYNTVSYTHLTLPTKA